MDLRSTIIHATAFGTLFFLVVGWFLLLGGISRVQKVCPGRCRSTTGLAWWIIWFQFAVTILYPFTQMLPSLRHGRISVMALFAVLAVLEMLGADDALNNRNQTGYSSGWKTAAAGYILLAACNLIAILLLGFLVSEAGPVGDSTTTAYNNPVAKPTNASGVPDANHRPFQSASGNVSGSQPAAPTAPAV